MERQRPGTSITLAPSASPFTLNPIIQDLVRTRFAVPGSIFLVEDVQTTSLTDSGRWQVIRLLLGDGELCIQAVLGDAMHRFVHTREITVGSYVCVQDFQLRLKSVNGSESQPMVYLVVYDLKTVGWNDDVRQMQQALEDRAKAPAGESRSTTPTKPRSAGSSQRRQDREDFEEDDMGDAFE
jgi:hypothetical protein